MSPIFKFDEDAFDVARRCALIRAVNVAQLKLIRYNLNRCTIGSPDYYFCMSAAVTRKRIISQCEAKMRRLANAAISEATAYAVKAWVDAGGPR